LALLPIAIVIARPKFIEKLYSSRENSAFKWPTVSAAHAHVFEIARNSSRVDSRTARRPRSGISWLRHGC